MSATSDPVDAPLIHADDRYFWDGVAERRLLIQRCTACGQKVHLLRARLGLCLPCQDQKFVWNGGDEAVVVYDPSEEEEK